MGANSFAIKGTATSMSVTGGIDQTYAETAKAVPNGIEVAVAAIADFRIRPFMEFKNRQPALQADGSYTKAKREAKLVFPRIDANGKPYFDVVRISLEASPVTSAADVLDMRLRSGQVLGLTTLETFWNTGIVR